MKDWSNDKPAYTAARLAMGVSIFMHGAVRVPGLSEFARARADAFDETFLAGPLATGAMFAIPLVEVAVGVLLLAGGRVIRWGLVTGIGLMGVLMFGTCLLEQWGWLPSQILHLLVFYFILINPQTYDPTRPPTEKSS